MGLTIDTAAVIIASLGGIIAVGSSFYQGIQSRRDKAPHRSADVEIRTPDGRSVHAEMLPKEVERLVHR